MSESGTCWVSSYPHTKIPWGCPGWVPLHPHPEPPPPPPAKTPWEMLMRGCR